MNNKHEWTNFIQMVEDSIIEVKQKSYDTLEKIVGLTEEYINNAEKITLAEKNRIQQLYQIIDDLLDKNIEEDKQEYFAEMKILNQHQKYLNVPVQNQNYLSIWK